MPQAIEAANHAREKDYRCMAMSGRKSNKEARSSDQQKEEACKMLLEKSMIPEGYADEPHDFEECTPHRAHCGNPQFRPKHIGLKRGHTWNKNVPRSAYPEIIRRFDSGDELASDIGREYGIGPVAVRSLVRRCKAHPELLEGGERK